GEIAAVGFPGRSMVKNIDRIVRRPTAGRRSPTDQTGKAEASRIDTIFFKIIAAPLFAGRFTDAINRGRIMCGVLGTIDPRGTWAKDRNAAGPEDADGMLLAGKVQDVEQATHIEVPGGLRFALAGGRKRGGEMVDLVDIVMFDEGAQGTAIKDIELFIGASL